MRNCIVAQSGGPTAVINASAYGVLKANLENRFFDKVYAGLNGIEGILMEKIIDFSSLTQEEMEVFKNTPSSGLGSCRYKMKNFQDCDAEYKKLISILKELQIHTFFYIGGNDSMDTIKQLSQYASQNNIDINFIGIPKTIDNDLVLTDHTPGFGSAAKFISTAVLETYLDSSVYVNNGIFILETMGRDTGWLAASSAFAKINGRPVADFIYLPEIPFNTEEFLNDVKLKFEEQNQVFIVVSEGVKNEEGRYLSTLSSSAVHDKFGHAQLGGVCGYLKNLIIENKITSRVKTLELGVLQRCAMHCASQTDIDEAVMVGKAAHKYATQNKTGIMVSIKRDSNPTYTSSTEPVDVTLVANNIKHFPIEWVSEGKNHIKDEAKEYFIPLLENSPELLTMNNLPQYFKLNRK